MTLHSRTKRVGEEIRTALASLIMTELKDPRLTDLMVTVNTVHVSKDLQNAQVYVSVLADDTESAKAVAALNQARAFLRRGVGEQVALRYTPNLTFKLDDTGRTAARINNLLQQIEREQPSRDATSEDANNAGANASGRSSEPETGDPEEL